VRVPFTIQWDRPNRAATIQIEGESIRLTEGRWSKWIDLTFKINVLVRLQGMVQLLLMNAGNELQLYISPVNFKPDRPPVPMSYPERFSGDLFKRLGYYRTLGWAEATWPLNEGRMDEKTFMDDLMVAFDDRAKVILNRLDAKNWDVLVGVIESTDRVQHMMWRLMDPKHPMYDAALAARFGDSVEREMIGIAQEALTNAVRHSRARRITIRASTAQSVGLRLSIADDGRGIARDRSTGGFGMISMQERAERIGASLTIVTAPRNGTEVVLAWEPTSVPTQVHVAG
jgi:hypothetical protein